MLSTPKRHELMNCLLQDGDADSWRIEAEDTAEGLTLHRLRRYEDQEDDEPEDAEWLCTLTMDGWRNLVEMFLLRHPERCMRMIAQWAALQRVKQGRTA